MFKIAYITSSRADYGIVRNFLNFLNDDDDIDLRIIVTGALLDEKYGCQVDLIYKDGFIIDSEIKTKIDPSSNVFVINNISETLTKFGELFSENKYDMIIILGDRYEMISVALAAAMQRLPILHIHGGESTYGNYDEFIRHSITKMSLYHYTATEEYKRRVIQLGENPNNVFCLGALGAENCLEINEYNVPEAIKKLPERKYFIVLFHPETLTNADVTEQITELLHALKKFSNYSFVFLGTNADTHSDLIRSQIDKFMRENANVYFYENLHTDAYHYLLKNGICLIGNSSSGIIEAPSLGVYTINIGNRQEGRIRGNSVIDVICKQECIEKAIRKVLNNYKVTKPVNPYLKKNSAEMYYRKTKELLNRLNDDIREPKKFYDII